MPAAKLVLENGLVFAGQSFGAVGESAGEVVFNTSMTGYQEILTDPSYAGQIVAMTYPQMGNYGINREDAESGKAWLSGFVCRELAKRPSNYRMTQRLEDFLAEQNVIGIEGVDTRTLVLAIRGGGAMRGILSTTDLDDERLLAKVRGTPSMMGRQLATTVMPTQAYDWTERNAVEWRTAATQAANDTGRRYKVAALDFGMKWNIGRSLTEAGCDVRVFPGDAKLADILASRPDGVFVSNGPGDPEPLGFAVDTLRGLLAEEVPTFGICLGHQLLGQALGGETFKLKFGHRGANQPVLNKETGRVEITTQNHGFAVSAESLPDDVAVTHVNLNDQTVEGLRHKTKPAFSVQYHPEAAAGPHDAAYLFRTFIDAMAQT